MRTIRHSFKQFKQTINLQPTRMQNTWEEKKKANEMYSHLSRDRTHSWGPVCPSVNTPVVLVNNAHVLPCVRCPCSEEWRSIVERTRKVLMDNLEKWKCFCVITSQPYIARTIPVTHQDSSKYFLLAHPPILFLRKSSKHHLLKLSMSYRNLREDGANAIFSKWNQNG